jgi:hypothetical protein
MKFTVNVKRMITTNLSEVDINEDKINEDFGSVDNFLLWIKGVSNTQKERNLLKKLDEKFPMDKEDYIQSVGNHIHTYEGTRFDTVNGIYEGGLDKHQHIIDYEKSLRFKKKDGTVVNEIKIEFE